MKLMDYMLLLSEILGTVAFAASGAMIAIERKLDLFGVICIGSVTALGGGTLRDVFLGQFPPQMFRNYRFLGISVVVSMLVFTLAYLFRDVYAQKEKTLGSLFNLFDAIGLAAFSVSGVSCAIEHGYRDNTFFCVFLGMTTAVGGGILRDMMTKSIPLILYKRIYAVAALTGSLVFWLLQQKNLSSAVSVTASMVVVLLIRYLATRFEWDLPRISK